MPRVLSSVDISGLKPTDPQPLFAPEADFDDDGLTDIAISGIYSLRTEGKKYFLLVASQHKPGRFEKMFYEERDEPLFLHTPGSTGEGDPGDQAFSFTLCANCDQGWDAYWIKSSRRFDLRPWQEKTKRVQKLVEVPSISVATQTVDAALQIVGKLPDVRGYTDGMKKKKKEFGVRVEAIDDAAPTTVRVRIYGKSKGKEDLYDAIVVDTVAGTIVKRQRDKKK